MKKRILSAVILLPLLLAILLAAPKLCTAILFGAMAAIAAYELLHTAGLAKNSRMVIYSMISAFLVSLWSYFGCSHKLALVGILVLTAALFGEMLAAHAKIAFQQAACCLAAGLLLPYPLTSLVRIDVLPSGRHLILIPFVLAMMSDTGAYFVGRACGRHKLAPVVSPHKTVEGAVGGVVFAVLGMMIYCLVLQKVFGFRVFYGWGVLYGVLGALAGMMGDLSFSIIKRQNGIKDYGNLIPGHGGILDRFDSMMLVGPLTEALLLLIPVAV